MRPVFQHSAAAALACGVAACVVGTQRPAAPRACESLELLNLQRTSSPASCPTELERSSDKIFDPYGVFDATSMMAHRVSVRLRAMPESIPSCPAGASPESVCPERDTALTEAQRANSAQVACVLAALGPGGEATPVSALWYEIPYRLSGSRLPVPIGVEFEVVALRTQIESLAAHPYVQRVSPAPGLVPMAASELDCLDGLQFDEPLPKLLDAQSIKGKGRTPVVLDLEIEDVLAMKTDPASECDAGPLAAAWARTILSTQRLTCVKRWVSAHLNAATRAGSYASSSLALDQPALPPFMQLSTVTNVFALDLTWDEAVAIAPHPYIRRIWTAPSLSSEPGASNCAPNAEPVPTHECTSVREEGTMKWTEQDRAYWETTQGPSDVMVTIRGGATVCQLPLCPEVGDDCPERQRLIEGWIAVNAEAQRCARQVMSDLGATAEPEVFWLVNAIQAYLTWPQIVEVAKHPDVQRIERSTSGARKP